MMDLEQALLAFPPGEAVEWQYEPGGALYRGTVFKVTSDNLQNVVTVQVAGLQGLGTYNLPPDLLRYRGALS